MIDIYLKTNTEQELIDILTFAYSDGKWIQATHDFALDIIGDMYDNDGVYDTEGGVITPSTKIQGFHANIRCNNDIAVQIPDSIIVRPLTPNRVFF